MPNLLLPDRSDLRRTLTLATPVVLVQLGIMSMGVVDTIMVGQVSPVDLAGAALGNLYFFSTVVFGMGLIMALDPVVSQAVGAREHENVARAIQRGMLIALGLSIVFTVLFLISGGVLTVLGQPAAVVPRAAGFVHNSIYGLPPFFGFLVLRQSLQAMRRLAPILWTILVANFVNAGLNWVFVYGHLGSPALGAPGSGLASSCGRWFMLAMLFVVARRDFGPLLSPWRRESFAPGPIARMIAIGVPIGVQLQLEVGLFAVVGLLMGRLGATAMAGHQVALNVASLMFMVPLGVSTSASVLVGQAIGAGNPMRARRAATGALAIGTGFMMLSGLLLGSIPHVLARIYSPDPGVVAMAAALLPVAAMFQVFDGLQVVSIGVLRGLGDTRTPMIVNVVGYWLLGMPLSLWLAFGLHLGPRGLWWGLVAGLAIVAIVLLVRVRARLGGTLERLVIEDGGARLTASATDPS